MQLHLVWSDGETMSRATIAKYLLSIALALTAVLWIEFFVIITGVGFDAMVLRAPRWLSLISRCLMWCSIGLCPILEVAGIVLSRESRRRRLAGWLLLLLWLLSVLSLVTLTTRAR